MQTVREQKLKEIVDLQDRFNERLDVNWRKRGWDWDSCITVEIGEALESLQFKHWKKQELDIENVKVEAIDILHFHISKELEHYATITLQKHLIQHFNYELENISSVPRLREVFNDYCICRRIDNLTAIFKALGMSVNEIYQRYIVKNALNILRQQNGYKDGSYIKMWNGVEDNKVALELWDNDFNFRTFYEKLEDRYNTIK